MNISVEDPRILWYAVICCIHNATISFSFHSYKTKFDKITLYKALETKCNICLGIQEIEKKIKRTLSPNYLHFLEPRQNLKNTAKGLF